MWPLFGALAYIPKQTLSLRMSIPVNKLHSLVTEKTCLCVCFVSARNRSRIVYEDKRVIFAPVRVFQVSKFRTETITLAENSICFLQSTPMPPGLHSWAIELHVVFVSLRIFFQLLQQQQRKREGVEGWSHCNTKTNLFVSKEKLKAPLPDEGINKIREGCVWPEKDKIPAKHSYQRPSWFLKKQKKQYYIRFLWNRGYKKTTLGTQG